MNEQSVTVKDLWPGDIIVARKPGGLSGTACRFVGVKEDGALLIMLRALDDEREFAVCASWEDSVEWLA